MCRQIPEAPAALITWQKEQSSGVQKTWGKTLFLPLSKALNELRLGLLTWTPWKVMSLVLQGD